MQIKDKIIMELFIKRLIGYLLMNQKVLEQNIFIKADGLIQKQLVI